MKTVGFCHKKNQSTHIKIGDLGVQPKKWFLKNVAPWEIDMGLNGFAPMNLVFRAIYTARWRHTQRSIDSLFTPWQLAARGRGWPAAPSLFFYSCCAHLSLFQLIRICCSQIACCLDRLLRTESFIFFVVHKAHCEAKLRFKSQYFLSSLAHCSARLSESMFEYVHLGSAVESEFRNLAIEILVVSKW